MRSEISFFEKQKIFICLVTHVNQSKASKSVLAIAIKKMAASTKSKATGKGSMSRDIDTDEVSVVKFVRDLKVSYFVFIFKIVFFFSHNWLDIFEFMMTKRIYKMIFHIYSCYVLFFLLCFVLCFPPFFNIKTELFFQNCFYSLWFVTSRLIQIL